MPQAVVAEISPGSDVVGLEPLLAVSHGVAATRNDLDGRLVIVPVVVVIVVVGTGERAADRRARDEAGEESAVTMMVPASMPSAVMAAMPATAGHMPAAATDETRRAATTAYVVTTAAATTANETRCAATAAAHVTTATSAAADMATAAASAATTANEFRRLREARGCHRQRRRKRDNSRCQYRFVIFHICNSICHDVSNSIDTLLRQPNVATASRFRNAGYGFVTASQVLDRKMRPNRALLPRPCWTSGQRNAINPSIFRDGFRP